MDGLRRLLRPNNPAPVRYTQTDKFSRLRRIKDAVPCQLWRQIGDRLAGPTAQDAVHAVASELTHHALASEAMYDYRHSSLNRAAPEWRTRWRACLAKFNPTGQTGELVLWAAGCRTYFRRVRFPAFLIRVICLANASWDLMVGRFASLSASFTVLKR